MRFRSPALAAAGGFLSGKVVRLLFKTLKNDVRMPGEAQPYNANPQQTKRFLYSAWHDSALIAGFGGYHLRTVALTSRHRDGTFTANLLKATGVGIVRGSTGRSGTQAAMQLLDTAKKFDIVITPDGPRGPKRVASRGIVFLASKTGNEIAPTAFACENAWEIQGSWTSLIIPKPFSKLVSMVGDTISVPPDLDKDGLEEYRLIVQDAMDRLQATADALIAGAAPPEVIPFREAKVA